MKRDTDQKLQLYSDKHHRFKERTVGRQRLQLQRLLNAQDEKIMKNTDKVQTKHLTKIVFYKFQTIYQLGTILFFFNSFIVLLPFCSYFHCPMHSIELDTL